MNFKWYRSQTAVSAMDDLLRALEYAEGRATIAAEPRSSLMAAHRDDRGGQARQRGKVEDPGPPYGRGV